VIDRKRSKSRGFRRQPYKPLRCFLDRSAYKSEARPIRRSAFTQVCFLLLRYLADDPEVSKIYLGLQETYFRMTRIRRLFDQPLRQQGRDLAAKGSPRRDTARAILTSLLANATTTTLRRTVDAVSLFPWSARSAPRRLLRRLHLRPKTQGPQRPYALRVHLQTMTIVPERRRRAVSNLRLGQ
jgi:glucose-6-phosphate dehydrogenase assembly protein OpcA